MLSSQQGGPQLAQPQDMAGDARSLAHLSLGTSTGLSLCCAWFCMCKVRPARNVSVIQPSLSWAGQQASLSCSVLHLARLVQPAGLLKQHYQGQAGGTEQCLPLLHLLAHQHPQCTRCWCGAVGDNPAWRSQRCILSCVLPTQERITMNFCWKCQSGFAKYFPYRFHKYPTGI